MDGASRSQLADRVGISVQYVCDIEEGRRTLKRNPGLVNKFAEVLGVPKSWLQRQAVADPEPVPTKSPNAAPKNAAAAKKPARR